MTNDDAPDIKKQGQAFHVEGLPVLLVFDKTGREVARRTEYADVPGLLTLVAHAQ
jgi:hypothetical protein